MYNVVTSFGNYPSNIALDQPGPFTAEELGLKWLEHCARFSKPDMLKKYRLVLLLPRDVVISHDNDPFLDAWGDRIRFDENSRVNAWPLGPNLCFQQILWLYHYKKMSGPFLWCEPDCIPVKTTWLDDLFEEYNNAGKPFMGAFVDQKTESGQQIPRHMTGNAIYPHEAYKIAPSLMEARLTPWDVYGAKQILPQCHYTTQIQHEYRHREILTRAEMEKIVRSDASLFHTDKFGAICRILAGERIQSERQPGKPLVEVFAGEGAGNNNDDGSSSAPPPPLDLDTMLSTIREMCRLSPTTKKKVAYFMLGHGIVNSGHFAQHRIRQKKTAANVQTDQPVEREVAT